MRFKVEVAEIRNYRVIYIVDARDQDEALEMAEAGETEEEMEVRLDGVLRREVYSIQGGV